MAAIPDDVREFVRKRANHRCEYCQTQELVVIYMEIDHVIPVSKGGNSSPDNLSYCCRICNTYKHDNLTGIDPETENFATLYNPRVDQWDEHFQWRDDGIALLGKTATGRATIQRLQINRPLNLERPVGIHQIKAKTLKSLSPQQVCGVFRNFILRNGFC